MTSSTRTIPSDRIPCIATPKDDRTPTMNNERLLLPEDLTCQQLIHVLRKRVDMKPNQAIFVFCENKIVNGNSTVRELMYSQREHNDGRLYIVYALENVFGCMERPKRNTNVGIFGGRTAPTMTRSGYTA